MKYSDRIYTLGNSNILTTYDTLKNSYFIECSDSASPNKDNLKLFFKQRKQIYKIINKIKPDVILFTSKHIWNFMMMPHLKMKGLKLFHVFHDPIGHIETRVSKGVVTYNKIVSKFLSGIIVHSDISYENTVQYIKPKCSVKKVPLGEKKWLPYRKPDFFKNKLLIFGRISSYKGCEFIPKLADELLKSQINCKIVVAGKALDDVDPQLIEEIQNRVNIDLHNEFIPESELDNYFYNTDASLILHKSISQSGVIIDAYRHGHPVLCFDIDGISEFITKDTAYIAQKFDIQALIRNINMIYSSFDRYIEMSQAAYDYGKTIFSEEIMANSIMEIFNMSYNR